MPFTTTFATLSARGFGLFGKQKVLTTVTFPGGTTTWTAPFGVNTITVASGKGSDGVSDSYGLTYTFHGTYNTLQSGTWPISGAYDGATGYNDAVYYLDLVNNSGQGIVVQTNYTFVKYSSATNTHEVTTSTPPVYRLYGAGTAYIYNPNWPTSGPVTTNATITTDATELFPGGPGVATTAFSLSFPGGAYSGGTGYPATTTTYTNVSVTPGTTYTIVNNGALTIQYYV